MATNYNHIVLHFDQAEQPKFTENKGKGYIEFGKENNYPSYLIDLYNESSKHGSIIKGKCNYIYGKGFENAGQANSLGDSWNKVMKRAIIDDETFGGYYLQIVCDRLGNVADVFNIPFHKVRVSNGLDKFHVKNDWSDNREVARVYDSFNYAKPTGTSVLYIHQDNSKFEYYPIPSYYQGLNYIESDIQVGRHILGNAKKGFVGSTLINLNNGEPIGEENKGEVENRLLKKFTGADGKRVVIMFNKSKENGAEILPLGQSMLTKEDFTNINSLITQEIFSAHQVTSPMLFGIKVEGQLGGRTELRDAYEIFNNTYVNERQQEHEAIFTKLRNLKGDAGDFKIIPVEPLKFEFSEAIVSANLTKDEIREIMGKDPLQPGQATSDGTTAAAPVTQADQQSSESIKNLTGRQYQNVMRIARQFGNGKLTKEQATLMLKNGFGFTDDDVNTFLGIDDDPLTDDEIQQFIVDVELSEALMFEKFGESRDKFEILSSKPEMDVQYFAEVKGITTLQANIIDLIRKDKRITPHVIAKTLKQDTNVIQRVMNDLVDAGYIKPSIEKIGQDHIAVNTVTKPLSLIPGDDATVTEILIRYSYEGPKDDKNRPFCAKMLQLDKLYSRSDIEQLSVALGYSVFDRRGGWLTMKDGTHRPYCRHRWVSNVVLRKKDKK